jgi:hypothetical protein
MTVFSTPHYDDGFRGLARPESDTDPAVMADRDDSSFRIKPGRSRAKGTRVRSRDLSFISQVKIAVRKAGGNPNRPDFGAGSGSYRDGGASGRFNARGRGAKVMASIPRDDGGWQRDSAGRFRSRRVVVKARVVKLAGKGTGTRGPKMRGGASAGAVDAHLRYLERDGVTRDVEKGRAYSAIENETDGRAFIERGRDDRHQFRFIVAPEDAAEMGDLRGFTRDLMRKMEADPGTDLD